MRSVTSLAGLCLFLGAWTQEKGAAVEITVLDKATGRPVPCRVELDNACGEPARSPDQLLWQDRRTSVCDGTARMVLPTGRYTYEIERGPEYGPLRGMVNIAPEETGKKLTVHLERFADLPSEGWWSGDLHVHRPIEDIERWMRAENLHVASVITWWNRKNLWADRKPPAETTVPFDGNRYYNVMGGEDERGGGALLFANLPAPLEIAEARGEFPPSLRFVREARRHSDAWVDMEKPYGWDVPMWLASGLLDSAGLANANMCREGMYRGGDEPGNCKVRDRLRLPSPHGNGRWTLETYDHMLNCGLRIPPSAGSASGGMPNPVGYNRVYVHVDGEFSYSKWWEGLRAGRSFVTNGPLLRCRAAGRLPGHVFSVPEGQEVDVEVTARVYSRDPIRTVELVKNGKVERGVAAAEAVRSGTLGRLSFKESGWFVVRAVVDHPTTFRFAQSAPFYVEIGRVKRRISKASAEFFRDWTLERARQLSSLRDPVERRDVLEPWDLAKKFWEERVAESNAP